MSVITSCTVALCQLRTELSWEQTMDKAQRMVAEAAARGADIVVLPEMFNCPYDRAYFRRFAETGHEASVMALSSWARDNSVILIGGSVPELDGGKLYNTCFLFDESGRPLARHRKAHLFDVDIPGMCFHESHTFASGDAITCFDTRFGSMGAAVCFDVRFPELFRAMAERGAQVVFLPAQFNQKTGPRSWELLLRARATDNQLFVVGCSAARYVGFSYECWGHSTVVDPFGAVLASCDETEQLLLSKLDLTQLAEARAQIPTLSALREDLYPVAK